MKMQWHNVWSVWTKRGAVSYRIGEGPRRSSSQPSLFFRSVEIQHLSEISTIRKTNAEHGEENVQMNTHAYVHRWMDQIYVKEFGVVENMFEHNIKKKN